MRPVKLVIYVVVAYLLFKAPGLLLGAPIPASLLSLYMLFAVITILLVMTITDEGVEGLMAPVAALVLDPSLRRLRNAVFVVLPVVLALAVYAAIGPQEGPPQEFRSVHPAPPAEFTAYGKTFEVEGLTSPVRALEATDPGTYAMKVREGGEVYFKNCFFCHGAKLDGGGHYAAALTPKPLSFLGTDTLAQLRESYVFWRVVKGGIGLPNEGAPWSSAMPAWEDTLAEDEVWKVIAFLYDYAGVRPRAEESLSARGVGAKAYPGGIDGLYRKRCAWCHGPDGEGDGVAAPYLNPPPRDFSFGDYKWTSTPAEEPSPADSDIYDSIAGRAGGSRGFTGLAGTSMPGWAGTLSAEEIHGLIKYIRGLSGLDAPDIPVVEAEKAADGTREDIESGRKLFLDRCSECHGKQGRGDATKRLKGDMGERTWPRNLTKPWTFRRGATPEEIYRRIAIGVPGTQMPSFFDPKSTKRLTPAEARSVAAYVATLGAEYKRPGVEKVVRAAHTKGELPEGPGDPAWENAAATSLAVFPQLVSKERHFTPSLDSVTVRALYNAGGVAVMLEWDDPTKSLPGDKSAMDIAGGVVHPDGAAIEFPLDTAPGAARPYFGMGGAPEDDDGGTGAVRIWHWTGPGGVGTEEKVELLDARGPKDIKRLEPGALGATGVYEDGQWKVVFSRPLAGGKPGGSARLRPGAYTPVAFAAWDGSNGETGGRHELTTWCYLLLEEEGSGRALRVVIALVVFLFVLGLEAAWALNARTYRA